MEVEHYSRSSGIAFWFATPIIQTPELINVETPQMFNLLAQYSYIFVKRIQYIELPSQGLLKC